MGDELWVVVRLKDDDVLAVYGPFSSAKEAEDWRLDRADWEGALWTTKVQEQPPPRVLAP